MYAEYVVGISMYVVTHQIPLHREVCPPVSKIIPRKSLPPIPEPFQKQERQQQQKKETKHRQAPSLYSTRVTRPSLQSSSPTCQMKVNYDESTEQEGGGLEE
ncbi:hypothetical protein CDAR_90231 [Caerostris darwini]|uniref:Uncharacterized protein n=1 Tax=Caerostris darwini TaxID=1538125 RepID=A0AAV4NQR4_9ARAC|nr:hypothetical protein CDAR_90231 [Caerostris darwini]